jgi:hypothetical protein
MRKAAKPQVVNIYTPRSKDKVTLIVNGTKTSHQERVWAEWTPQYGYIIVEERRRLSLGQAVAWLRDKLQRLARRLGIARVSPEPCHSHALRACEESTPVMAVRAHAKRKSRRKRRKGLESRKRTVRRS